MTKDDLIKKLKDRFYYLNEQGLQRYYWIVLAANVYSQCTCLVIANGG